MESCMCPVSALSSPVDARVSRNVGLSPPSLKPCLDPKKPIFFALRIYDLLIEVSHFRVQENLQEHCVDSQISLQLRRAGKFCNTFAAQRNSHNVLEVSAIYTVVAHNDVIEGVSHEQVCPG